jgi:4-amino-4-deoxy-L-arabinose transferase-like glycosyltransferase
MEPESGGSETVSPPHSMPGAPRMSRPQLFLLLYLLAAGLRLIPVLSAPNLPIGLDDMFQYDMLGRSLAAGHGFRWYAPPDQAQIMAQLKRLTTVNESQITPITDPLGVETTFRAPLYPAFLAVIYAVNGVSDRFYAVRLVQALLGGLLAPLSYALARRFGGSGASLAAAIAVSAWPMLVALPLGLATENLFIPLLAAGFLLLLRGATEGRSRDFALAGLMLGLGVLTRSVIIGFPLLAGIWIWRRGQRQGAIMLVGVVVLMALPWSVRNSLLDHKPTFVETSLGYNLYLGYYPSNDGTFRFGPSLDLVTITDDAVRDQVGRERALAFIEQDPGRIPQLMLAKLGHLWGLEDRAFIFFYSQGLLGPLPGWVVLAIYLILTMPLVVLLPPAILGFTLRRDGAAWWLAVWLLAWYVGIHMLIMAEERFHLALLPIVAALAARGVTQIVRLRRDSPQAIRAPRLALALAGALIGLACLNWGLEIIHHAPELAVLMAPGGSSANFSY